MSESRIAELRARKAAAFEHHIELIRTFPAVHRSFEQQVEIAKAAEEIEKHSYWLQMEELKEKYGK